MIRRYVRRDQHACHALAVVESWAYDYLGPVMWDGGEYRADDPPDDSAVTWLGHVHNEGDDVSQMDDTATFFGWRLADEANH